MILFSSCACDFRSSLRQGSGMGGGRGHRCRRRLTIATRGLARALRLNWPGGSSEVVLGDGTFFLHQFLAPHFLVFRIGLREVVVPKALAGAQVARAFGVA